MVELNGLSSRELELLKDFITQTHDSELDSVATVLTTQESTFEGSFGSGLPDLLYYLSDTVSNTDRQVMRLNEMRKNIQEIVEGSLPERDLPEDAKISSKELHWLAINSELISFYSQVGVLIEEFSTELILNDVVDSNRRSNRVERDIANKSQSQREWLLFVTGVIDSGEKDQLRDTYRKRNKLVHNADVTEIIEDVDEINSEISSAWDTVNYLHRKLYGVEMRFRISETLIGNDFPD
ncbi:hypothetical protein [Halobellus salinisoli]|uniref:hypothetical protein n=1 Tax=Halobellus salinisoli TaxID=3108500 RepID=UPI00300A78EB